MGKMEFQTSKEETWRNHVAGHAAGGKSIAAFCRDEAISQASFHVWRTKLANGASERAAVPTPASTFIDLGAVSGAIAGTAPTHSPHQRHWACPASISASISAAVPC